MEFIQKCKIFPQDIGFVGQLNHYILVFRNRITFLNFLIKRVSVKNT